LGIEAADGKINISHDEKKQQTSAKIMIELRQNLLSLPPDIGIQSAENTEKSNKT